MSIQLTRLEAKEVFSNALSTVADGFDPDEPEFLQFTFTHFHPFHKLVFLNQLKKLLLDKHFEFEGKEFCYDVTLNESMFDDWENFEACIEYIYTTQQRKKVMNKITEF
jgi:hypothetical protein